MSKQDLGKLLNQSAARSTPLEIRRGKGVGLSVEEETFQNAQTPPVLWVDIDHILDNPYQHAEEINPEDYAALVEAIKIDGFQGALNVSPLEGREGSYFITGGGHQRRNAARDAGLTQLPVFVAASPAEKKQLGLRLARENTAQVNRSPVNLGFLYIQLIEEYGMTQEEIASEIKKDRYHVNFAIMAARSAADIRAALREKYSPRVMTYLRRVAHEEDRAPIIAKYLAGDLTVEGVRVAVENALKERKKPEEQQQPPTLPPALETEHASEPHEKQHDVSPLSEENREGSVDPAHAHRAEQQGRLPLPSVSEDRTDQAQALLHQVKMATHFQETEAREREAASDLGTSERVSKVQAAFSRIETYRRFIEKKRADGEVVILSDQEATMLGKIIDRCHTLLDSYGKR
jgi:ParB/RepB/Spo0J family partition protein